MLRCLVFVLAPFALVVPCRHTPELRLLVPECRPPPNVHHHLVHLRMPGCQSAAAGQAGAASRVEQRGAYGSPARRRGSDTAGMLLAALRNPPCVLPTCRSASGQLSSTSSCAQLQQQGQIAVATSAACLHGSATPPSWACAATHALLSTCRFHSRPSEQGNPHPK